MKFSDMKVSTRLYLSFGLLLACLVLIIAVGINRMAEINTRLNSIANINNVEGRHAWTMRTSILAQSVITREFMLSSDAAERRALLERMRAEIDLYGRSEKELDDMFRALVDETQPKERAAMDQVLAQSNISLGFLNKLLDRAQADDVDGMRAVLDGGFRTEQNKLNQRLQELVQLEDTLNHAAGEEAATFYRSAVFVMVVLGTAAILAGLALALAISRGIRQQLGGEPTYAAAIANKIAAGDLTSEVELPDANRPSLLLAMKSMNENLLNIVREVRTGSDAISTATHQIAVGNMDLSSRTEQQAGSLEETAAAIEQLTSTVKQNAENSATANELATSAAQVAEQGGAMVQQVVSTMTSIDESSKKIVNIINVIDSISFQTNILALNAAVEAARAGEQGRGFAVVASEVRSLAQRSTAAAKEIKELIDASVANVNAGYQLVQEAGSTMSGVVDSVRRVCSVIAEITAASREQATGIQQVNDAIVQMDQTTQQNAALVEEAAAAAKLLQEQAQRLASTVGVFSITSGVENPEALRLA